MDTKAFWKMSYGLYIISAKNGEKAGGCVVNTMIQVTSEPLQVTVTINKENYTAGLIQESGYFTGIAACTISHNGADWSIRIPERQR